MIVVLLWLALQSGAAVSPEIRQHVEAGLKAKHEGNLELAIQEFEQVVALAPGLAAAHVNLGAAYSEKKEYAKAIPSLRRALELSPSLTGAHGMLGAALLGQGYANEAIPHLERGQMGDLLGVALLEAGRVAEATSKLEEALARRPDDPDLLFYLGQAHGRLSKQLFDRLIAQGHDSPRARQLLGQARAATGNREAAEREFKAALELRPDLHGVHLALGELCLGSGDYHGAEREFRAELQMVPGSAVAAYRLGAVLLNLGNTAEATSYLKRSNELRPEMPETQYELGRALALSGDLAEAEKLLGRVLEQEKTSQLAESAHFQLAQVLRRTSKIAEAEREMARFQQLRALRKERNTQ